MRTVKPYKGERRRNFRERILDTLASEMRELFEPKHKDCLVQLGWAVGLDLDAAYAAGVSHEELARYVQYQVARFVGLKADQRWTLIGRIDRGTDEKTKALRQLLPHAAALVPHRETLFMELQWVEPKNMLGWAKKILGWAKNGEP